MASRLIAVAFATFMFFGQASPSLRPDPPLKCSACDEWNQPREPFRIFGNAYFVGTVGLSAILVTSAQGHILLDGGLSQSAPLIDANIRKLGFKTEDIKLIVNSHAHYDHAAGIAALQRASGAVVAATASGAQALQSGENTPDDPQYGFGREANAFPAVKNVRVVKDREVVEVAGLAIQAHDTAGHTPGSTTWTWRSCDTSAKATVSKEQRCLNMVYADSLTPISAPGFRFTGDARTPSRVEKFRQSIATVAALPCDIVVTTHPGATDLDGKLKRRAEKPAVDPLIDPQGCRALAATATKQLDARIAEETGLATAVASPSALTTQTTQATIALVGARVYPDPNGVPIDDATVVLAGGLISAVGPRAAVAVPSGATVIEAKGLVITAGFQNSHVHFTDMTRWADAAKQPAGTLTTHLREMVTKYGFTTIVDTASDLANTKALRRRIDSGDVSGPRILTAGFAIYPPDGVPYYVRDEVPAELLRLLPQPASAAAARAVVRQQLDEGADLVKLFVGSWVARGKVLPMPADIAGAAASEAHARKLPVLAHPSNLAGLEVALGAGVDVLAHAIEDTRGMTDAHYARMKRQNMAMIPTLYLFRDRWMWDVLDEVRTFARQGGQILFGTDVGYLPNFDHAIEYDLMAAAGLGWREILTSLTVNAAERFGESARRGRVAVGLDADLVVLGSDPAHGVRNLSDVRYTIRAGRVIYQK